MINLTEKRNNRIRIPVIAVSILLFTISLTQVAFYTGNPEDGGVLASFAFLFGWMALMGSGITWLANFFLICSWILFFSKPKYAQYCALLAVLFAGSFFLIFDSAIADEGGSQREIVAYGTGYWLWLSSCLLQFVGIIFFRYKSNYKDDLTTTPNQQQNNFAIEDIKKMAKEYARKIDLENLACLWQGDEICDDFPYIKVDASGMHYMVYQRGVVCEHRTTHEVDELLYWIFSNFTFVLAHNFENENRQESKDIRCLIHSKQLELLEKLNPKWRDLEQQKQQQLLIKSPYNDFA